MKIVTATAEMAQDIIDYVKVTSAETDNLVTTPEEFNITLEQEIDYLNKQKDIRLGNILVALDGNEIVGLSGLHGREGRVRIGHVVSLGITIKKSHWGQGIGYLMMMKHIEYAQNNEIYKINLEVRTDNQPAIHLYEKCGFEMEGTNRRSMFIDGEYVDTYYMGLVL